MSSATSAFAYAVGDEIFLSEPWIYSILASKIKSHCYHCLERPKNGCETRRCTGCLLAGYCSDVCQKADWKPRHRDECKVLKGVPVSRPNKMAPQLAVTDDNLERLMVLLKIIGKLKQNAVGDNLNACRPAGSRTFTDLMSHESELLRLRPNLLVSYNLLKPYLDQADPEHKICADYLSFLRLWGKFLINNFAVYDMNHPAVVGVGRGIYLQPSILDHSCVPNALQCNVGKIIRITAIRAIRDKKDVRISYMSPFDLTETRRAYLDKGYFFTCQCLACTDHQLDAERNAVLCANKSCLAAIPLTELPTTIVCRQCKSDNTKQLELANSAINRLHKLMLEVGQCKTDMGNDRQSRLQNAIQEGAACLYPTNFTLGVAHQQMVGILGDQESPLDENMEHLLAAVVCRRYNSYCTMDPEIDCQTIAEQVSVLDKLIQSEHIRVYCYQPCFLVLKWLVEKNRDREALAFATQVSDFFKQISGEDSMTYREWCRNVSEL